MLLQVFNGTTGQLNFNISNSTTAFKTSQMESQLKHYNSGRPHLLPIEVVCQIFSQLCVEEKMFAAEAIGAWHRALRCPSSWTVVNLVFSKECLSSGRNLFCIYSRAISEFGEQFQNVKISCSHPQAVPFYFSCMRNISKHCILLKSFTVSHPIYWGFHSEVHLEDYCQQLLTIARENNRLKSITLMFHKYTPRIKCVGFEEVLSRITTSDSLLMNKIDHLEFTLTYPPIANRYGCLTAFKKLRKLRCLIHHFNTNLVITLLQETDLIDLILVNNATTQDMTWVEEDHIKWTFIQDILPDKVFNVHYCIEGRSWEGDFFVTNPYLHTLILNSEVEYYCIYSIITSCCEKFADSLQVLMLLSCETVHHYVFSEDDLDMYSTLVQTCPLLHTFISMKPISASAVVTIAAQKKLKNLFILDSSIQYTSKGLPKRKRRFSHNDPEFYVEDIKVDWWKQIVRDRDSLVKTVANFHHGSHEWSPTTQAEIDYTVCHWNFGGKNQLQQL